AGTRRRLRRLPGRGRRHRDGALTRAARLLHPLRVPGGPLRVDPPVLGDVRLRRAAGPRGPRRARERPPDRTRGADAVPRLHHVGGGARPLRRGRRRQRGAVPQDAGTHPAHARRRCRGLGPLRGDLHRPPRAAGDRRHGRPGRAPAAGGGPASARAPPRAAGPLRPRRDRRGGAVVMSAAAAPTGGGQVHGAGFYRSDAEFGALVVDFIDSAVAAGEPVIIGFDRRKTDLIRSRIADDTGVSFVGESDHYSAPTRAIGSYQRQFEKHLAEGATRVRIAGEVPAAGTGRSFSGWDRYEAGINALWRELPVWSRCIYDSTALRPDVRDVVLRAHPRLVAPDGRVVRSADYEDPERFAFLPVEPHPFESAPPTRRLVDCSPGGARTAIR